MEEKEKYDHSKDLTDISKRPDFKEITSKGGKVRSQNKKDAQSYRASCIAKCKFCPVRCDYKEGQLERDPEAMCIVPLERTNAIKYKTGINFLNKDNLEGDLKEVLKFFIEQWKKETDPKKKKKWAWYIGKHGIDMKINFLPEVQKSININVTTTTDEVMKRILNFREKAKVKIEVEVKEEPQPQIKDGES